MVVARHPIKRRQVITETDVQIVERDVSNMRNAGIPAFEEVIGKRASRAIRAGGVLYTDLVELPELIRRGDVISIVAESKGMTITTRGQASKGGYRGERIQVVNLDSKKQVYARVVDSNTVQVDF